MSNEFDKYYEATEPGYRERAIGWATAIGLQDVDGLKPSKYLISTAKRNIEGEITANEARQLVDAYYEVKDALKSFSRCCSSDTTWNSRIVFCESGRSMARKRQARSATCIGRSQQMTVQMTV